MDIYFLIKVFSLSLAVLGCVVATFTDIKYAVIPNSLTFPLLAVGIVCECFFFASRGSYRLLFFNLALVVVAYMFCYLLWRIGVWAGGDVKLFTALSCLLVASYFDVVPRFSLGGLCLPGVFSVHGGVIFYVIFYSVVSILPVSALMLSSIILKSRRYLIKDVATNIDLNYAICINNSLVITVIIISLSGVYVNILFRILLLIVLSYINTKILNKNKKLYYTITALLIIQQLITYNIIAYTIQLAVITALLIVKALFNRQILKRAMSDKIRLSQLEEGQILSYPLTRTDNIYAFTDKSILLRQKENKDIIIDNMARGLNKDEIQLLWKLYSKDSYVMVKKTTPFAPYILVGVILTILIGDFRLIEWVIP